MKNTRKQKLIAFYEELKVAIEKETAELNRVNVLPERNESQ